MARQRPREEVTLQEAARRVSAGSGPGSEGAQRPARAPAGRGGGWPALPRERTHAPGKAALGMAGWTRAVGSLGGTCRRRPAPARGPPGERQAGQGPSLGSAGASGPLRQAGLRADPGSEGGGGGEGGHCCGFAAKEGTYLGYLGDRQGSGPAAPGLCLPALTTGTCHLRNVFIFSQSLARFPPHSLRAGRGAGRRGKVKVRAGSKEGWKRVPNSALCKENTMGPANSACHSVRHHPTGLPKPPPTTPQEVTFHPGPWPAEGTRGTRGPKCRVGSIRLAERGTLSPRTPVKG